MLTSARWINDYLDPPADPDLQAELLTRAGFPLEDRQDVQLTDGRDVRQDYEMTSNRGDCVCHLGLAREIAAISGRTLNIPQPTPEYAGPDAHSVVKLTNREPRRCPLYTGRVILGATVRPSPKWLTDRLLARGDIPRNNVVDATNFVLFELGQPTHVFDIAKLEGPEIIVRMAHWDEPFLPIGEGESEVCLGGEDLVIADARRAVAIAGVKGGALTAVTDQSTDFLLEAAAFDPVAVRNTSRRLGIASESSYRFERGVHPGQVNQAADRLAQLILELAGGELCPGVLSAGLPIPPRRSVSMRTDRCRKILGVPVSDRQILDSLFRLGFEPRPADDHIDCLVPYPRLDIQREIDLIEEVGRMFGHDNIPVTETVRIRVAPPQPSELARQAVANELVGLGFVETVTHSLISDDDASLFLTDGCHALRVDDQRAGAAPALQPSTLPSLLRVRRLNQDNGVDNLRLFESAGAFWGTSDGHEEIVKLGLLMDVHNPHDGLRPIRGTIERIAEILLGHEAVVNVKPLDDVPWLSPGAAAYAGDANLGLFGRLSADAAKRFHLNEPVLVAELQLAELYQQYPPETPARPLPTFPAIERDLSAVVDEPVTWRHVRDAVDALRLDCHEASLFITTFRGKQIPKGKKSLTFRLRFRAADRTLKHEEVDPQIDAVMNALQNQFHAQIRD